MIRAEFREVGGKEASGQAKLWYMRRGKRRAWLSQDESKLAGNQLRTSWFCSTLFSVTSSKPQPLSAPQRSSSIKCRSQVPEPDASTRTLPWINNKETEELERRYDLYMPIRGKSEVGLRVGKVTLLEYVFQKVYLFSSFCGNVRIDLTVGQIFKMAWRQGLSIKQCWLARGTTDAQTI